MHTHTHHHPRLHLPLAFGTKVVAATLCFLAAVAAVVTGAVVVSFMPAWVKLGGLGLLVVGPLLAIAGVWLALGSPDSWTAWKD